MASSTVEIERANGLCHEKGRVEGAQNGAKKSDTRLRERQGCFCIATNRLRKVVLLRFIACSVQPFSLEYRIVDCDLCFATDCPDDGTES